MSFSELYKGLEKIKTGIMEGAELGLEVGANRVLEAAQSKPGSYQPAVPPFPAWAKLKKGTSPLLKSGKLKSSISISKSNDTQHVGVSGYGAIHEAGSGNVPQRAFLRPALIESKEKILADVIEGIRAKIN